MLNDQAIASNYLIDNNLAKKVMIIDLDVHQGDGTASIFEHQDSVFTISHSTNSFIISAISIIFMFSKPAL